MQHHRFLPHVISLGISIMACALLGVAQPIQARDRDTASTSASVSSLDGNEIAGMKYIREEEKVAHDLYAVFYARWNTSVFSTITSSESSHMAAMLNLLKTYAIEDPAASNPPGVFTDASLQALYDTLLARGQSSEIEALKVGALVEETDIRDIRERESLTDESLIVSVYENLMCGSRNHLRAFNKQLLSRGVTYVPVVISQAEWNAIADAPIEICR
jgi:hypothetical protein